MPLFRCSRSATPTRLTISANSFEETKVSVTVKVNRGAFPAWFFFAAMKAIGRENVSLADL